MRYEQDPEFQDGLAHQMIPGNVHLITTCTRRKTVPAGETLFPAADEVSTACDSWQQMLKQAIKLNPAIAAGELYTGQHWRRAAETEVHQAASSIINEDEQAAFGG